ncbi:hypothetical protein TVAG_272450 [Trichomonas vaginalis G3]|uniref:Uncharacterized protein n=1 Tax=Trichomonas vaginalis (strain ATCC PRA-98 / G3) TaxID=412133 RepID=A2FDW1_TRIV3|nr:hypothetical protein TVAGG3_0728940 [Trichomonas vaginalis G3]EAX96917.1 hypothetical protein TVAG_272450 [Trichomonas vaginalis G3]KAI5511105.1 hypothetical protein TVAGG3_0728940 [Trichomonas vaginalis G3]|eukprot:XP_001309847.1 hypothetical protein [Trichomonas vaginalis G3]
MYFHKICEFIAKRAPQEIRNNRSVPKIPDKRAYELAARFVAQFLEKHNMTNSRFIAGFETAGFIPKREIISPYPILQIKENRSIVPQLLNCRKLRIARVAKERSLIINKGSEMSETPRRPASKGLLEMLEKEDREQRHRRKSESTTEGKHHRHHHHDRKKISPDDVSINSANLPYFAPEEYRQFGIDPNDPQASYKLLFQFKLFLNAKKHQKENPPTPKEPVYIMPPPPQEVQQPLPPPLPVPPKEPSVVYSESSRSSKYSIKSSSAAPVSSTYSSLAPTSNYTKSIGPKSSGALKSGSFSNTEEEEEEEEEDFGEEEEEEEDFGEEEEM